MKATRRTKPKAAHYPRDLVGYGKRLPDPKWPGGARLALQISLNYEAGGELSLLHGDRVSEAMLTDIGFPAVRGARSPLVESSFEYGSRRGVWRLLRLFEERKIVVGILAVATALARNREVAVQSRFNDRNTRVEQQLQAFNRARLGSHDQVRRRGSAGHSSPKRRE